MEAAAHAKRYVTRTIDDHGHRAQDRDLHDGEKEISLSAHGAARPEDSSCAAQPLIDQAFSGPVALLCNAGVCHVSSASCRSRVPAFSPLRSSNRWSVRHALLSAVPGSWSALPQRAGRRKRAGGTPIGREVDPTSDSPGCGPDEPGGEGDIVAGEDVDFAGGEMGGDAGLVGKAVRPAER